MLTSVLAALGNAEGMVSTLKDLIVLLEETWIRLIIQPQCKTGIQCSAVFSTVSVVYRSLWTEGLSEEFIEEGKLEPCNVG